MAIGSQIGICSAGLGSGGSRRVVLMHVDHVGGLAENWPLRTLPLCCVMLLEEKGGFLLSAAMIATLYSGVCFHSRAQSITSL